jgi:hypothetical protein
MAGSRGHLAMIDDCELGPSFQSLPCKTTAWVSTLSAAQPILSNACEVPGDLTKSLTAFRLGNVSIGQTTATPEA